MIKENTTLAYSEIYEILNLLEEEYKEKVPKKIREFFRNERNIEYTPKIDTEIPLDEQNLKRETMVLLAILNLNYWCESEEEKQKFLKELEENEKEQEKIKEKYNPDNLFNQRQKKINEEQLQQNTNMVIYKETNFIKKLLNKIKQLFKKEK